MVTTLVSQELLVYMHVEAVEWQELGLCRCKTRLMESPAIDAENTYHNMDILRLHLMHRVHIVKSSDCTIDTCLSRRVHKTLNSLEVGVLILRCHVCPFGASPDLVGGACPVGGRNGSCW